jgi:hypothetical protein
VKRWVFAGLLILASPAVAADKPNGRMQACTQAWQEAGRTEVYKVFLTRCLSQPAVKKVAVSIRAKPGRAETPKAKTATRKKSIGPNRMKICGAQWQKLKAEGATGGQTWRAFSKQCLKT